MRRLAGALGVFCAIAATGCSFPIESMFEKAEAGVDQTGSTSLGDRAGQAAENASPSDADLSYARAAAIDALTRGPNDNSIPWENPHSGASGNITPLAVSYNQGGLVCRDFLASYVRGQAQAWMQGEACRPAHGNWEVKSLKPLRQG
jgi:surface antigen